MTFENFRKFFLRAAGCSCPAILACLLFVPFAGAQSTGKASLSSDDMLQYTLNELKNRLQDVVRDNTKLSNRNNALRKRMLSLRQDMRELENYKLSLMERNNDLRDFLKLDSQEYALVKKKIEELEEHDSLSDNVTDALIRAIDQNESRQEKLEATIAKVEGDIKGIHQTRSAKYSSRDEARDEEKNDLVLRIRRLGEGNRSLEKQFPELRKKVSDAADKKRSLRSRQAALKSQIETLEVGLEQVSAENENISGEVKAMSDGRNKSAKSLEAQVDRLTATHDMLTGAIEDAVLAREKVRDDITAQETEVKRISGLLTNEKQLLEEQRRILSVRLKYQGGAEDQQPKIEEEIAALTEKTETLRTDGDQLKADIAEQEHLGLELKNKEAGFQKEIAQINLSIKEKERQGRQSKEDALKSRKSHLAKLINDFEAKGQALKKQIADRQKQRDQSREKIKSVEIRGRELAADLKAGADELVSAQEEEKAIRQTAKDLENRQGKGSLDLKKEIETLELRKTVLISSRDAIRSKYDQDKDAIQEFLQGDQKDLEEYLEVLRAENLALKDKALSLSRSIRNP